MKIALFVHCFFPAHFYGTEAYTLALAKELRALGHEPTVVTATFPGEARQPELLHAYRWEGIDVLSIDKNAYPPRSVRETYAQPELVDVHMAILKRLDPDIVHICHLMNHTTALFEAAARCGVPTVATLTDFFGICVTNRLETVDHSLCTGPNAQRSNCVACYLSAALQPVDTLLVRTIRQPAVVSALARLAARYVPERRLVGSYRAADIVARPDILANAYRNCRTAIAPTAFLKRLYESNGFPVPIEIVRFGIDIDRARHRPSRSDGDLRLGYIGQIAPHKGLHVLIEALRKCWRSTFSLEIWGSQEQDAVYSRALEQAARGLPVSFRGTFPPAELAGILHGIDLLVIPSTWYENSPLILLQALATHTPVLVSDVDGMTEFIAHDRTGFQFARGNAGALAAELMRIADTPGLLDRVAAEADYPRTPRDMALDTVRIYRAALERQDAVREP